MEMHAKEGQRMRDRRNQKGIELRTAGKRTGRAH